MFLPQSSDDSRELNTKSREGRIFPGEERNEIITCMSLGSDFLIYGTEVGYIILLHFKYISSILNVHCVAACNRDLSKPIQ